MREVVVGVGGVGGSHLDLGVGARQHLHLTRDGHAILRHSDAVHR